MSRDSMVSSLPSNGWSCATLEEGIQIAAQQAGLTLKTQDYTKARMHVHHIDISSTGPRVYSNWDCHYRYTHHLFIAPVIYNWLIHGQVSEVLMHTLQAYAAQPVPCHNYHYNCIEFHARLNHDWPRHMHATYNNLMPKKNHNDLTIYYGRKNQPYRIKWKSL